MAFNMNDIIFKKREGGKLSKDEIDWLITGYVAGDIPDYQVSALLMAIFFRGLDREETFNLTNAMRYSGDTIDLSPIKGIKVDKHSTGGVGDKTTLIVAPLASACGVPIAKMSGRGLGFHRRHCGQNGIHSGIQDIPCTGRFSQSGKSGGNGCNRSDCPHYACR